MTVKARTVHRGDEELRGLYNRLSRIEGQLRGIRKMLDEDAYCTDIITQVSAAQAALGSFSKELLARHIRRCVVDDIRSGNSESVDDLIDTLQRLMK
jgi:DNA-binding FrmR family transcriptional regulator